MQMANKYLTGCLTSLIIKEMQIKATVIYHLMAIRTDGNPAICDSIGEIGRHYTMRKKSNRQRHSLFPQVGQVWVKQQRQWTLQE